MKHFLIEITYRVPADQLGPALTEHRAYLKTGFDQGLLLMSGPQVPRTGGWVIARADSRSTIEAFFASDPYHLRGVADHRIIEFEPVLSQPFLSVWL
jgi:uncharacterized protein YciI